METKAPVIFPEFAPEGFENKWITLSHDEYHNQRDAVHSSSLKHILKSPWAYHHYLMNPPTGTKAMRFGTLAHNVLLKGSEFLKRYQLEPKFEGATLDGKMSTRSKAALQAKAEWYENLLPGTEVVTQEEYDRLRWMLDSILKHKIASQILSDGTPEAQGTWRDPVTGLKCIMEADFISNSLGALVEFKTTQSCIWSDFRRTVESLQYYLQIAHYDEGIFRITKKRPEHRIWVTTESVSPYETKCHEVHSVYENAGQIDLRRAYNAIKTSIVNNSFDQAQVVLEEAFPSKWLEEKYINME